MAGEEKGDDDSHGGSRNHKENAEKVSVAETNQDKQAADNDNNSNAPDEFDAGGQGETHEDSKAMEPNSKSEEQAAGISNDDDIKPNKAARVDGDETNREESMQENPDAKQLEEDDSSENDGEQSESSDEDSSDEESKQEDEDENGLSEYEKYVVQFVVDYGVQVYRYLLA
jgi:hypothetical protein